MIEVNPSYSYSFYMKTYTITETRRHLSKLIDRALADEEVIVTRHGQPVVEIKPLQKPLKQMTQDCIEWLKSHRVGSIMPSLDAAELVSQLRDENERY